MLPAHSGGPARASLREAWAMRGIADRIYRGGAALAGPTPPEGPKAAVPVAYCCAPLPADLTEVLGARRGLEAVAPGRAPITAAASSDRLAVSPPGRPEQLIHNVDCVTPPRGVFTQSETLCYVVGRWQRRCREAYGLTNPWLSAPTAQGSRREPASLRAVRPGGAATPAISSRAAIPLRAK